MGGAREVEMPGLPQTVPELRKETHPRLSKKPIPSTDVFTGRPLRARHWVLGTQQRTKEPRSRDSHGLRSSSSRKAINR